MIFGGEVEHHSALSWFVRIEYGMVRVVLCSPGRAVVNLLFRQLAGVPIIDVCIDHVLVDYCQAFVLGEFPFEVEESSLGCEEVVRKIWIILLPQQAGSYLTPLCLVVVFKMLHALSSSLLTGLATFGLVPKESKSINCSSRRSHLSSARLVWKELYSL